MIEKGAYTSRNAEKDLTLIKNMRTQLEPLENRITNMQISKFFGQYLIW